MTLVFEDSNEPFLPVETMCEFVNAIFRGSQILLGSH